MITDWRMVVQRVLKSIIVGLEPRPAKTWTREGQRIAIYVAIAAIITSGFWLVGFIFLLKAANPAPACVSSECFQSVWQGRWAMGSFIVGGLTLGAVVWGFKQNKQTLSLENCAYLSANIVKTAVSDDGVIYIKIELQNFGRTRTENLSISVVVDVVAEAEDRYISGPFRWHEQHRRHLYPDNQTHAIYLKSVAYDELKRGVGRPNFAQLRKVKGMVVVAYDDVFGGKHSEIAFVNPGTVAANFNGVPGFIK